MTDLLTAETERLRRRAADIAELIQNLEGQIIEQRRKLAEVEGEMRGLERAAELFGQAAPTPPKRHSVQPVVMAAIKPGESWTFSQLVNVIIHNGADLPEDSIRDFVGRAVRTGKLTLSEAGYYSLPPAQGNGLVT